MDIEYFRQRLLQREQELVGDISRFRSDAREASSADVKDIGDQATSSDLKELGFEEATLASRTLAQVREALQRIDRGTYGICIDCGQSIEPARLEAVPWTPYCLADQERHDKEGSEQTDPTQGLTL